MGNPRLHFGLVIRITVETRAFAIENMAALRPSQADSTTADLRLRLGHASLKRADSNRNAYKLYACRESLHGLRVCGCLHSFDGTDTQ